MTGRKKIHKLKHLLTIYIDSKLLKNIVLSCCW